MFYLREFDVGGPARSVVQTEAVSWIPVLIVAVYVQEWVVVILLVLGTCSIEYRLKWLLAGAVVTQNYMYIIGILCSAGVLYIYTDEQPPDQVDLDDCCIVNVNEQKEEPPKAGRLLYY